MDLSDTAFAVHLRDWAPGLRADTDALAADPTTVASALLDLPAPAATGGDPLPPLWHWFHFLDWPRQDELGADGHPAHGHFLPPIPDRQRMFAGGRCEFLGEPLRIGTPAERVGTLGGVSVKQGRTGQLLFVTQRNEYRQDGRTRMIEELHLVYRSGRSTARHPAELDTSAVPEPRGAWQLNVQPERSLLFRFSALTANAHRIHYDAAYATGVEGYPDLVVHGPLLVLLMLELVRRNTDRPVRSLSFQLHLPVFVGEHLLAAATPTQRGADLQIATQRADQHATAQVSFA